MKIFIRKASLNSPRPEVIAFYDDNTEIPEGAHGEGMMIMNVPANAFVRDRQDASKGQPDPMPKLIDGWRDSAKEMIVNGEADRRIKEVLPPDREISALHEMLSLIMQHGTDVSKWSQDAQKRRGEIDDALNYVRAVRERARSFASTPRTASSSTNSSRAWHVSV